MSQLPPNSPLHYATPGAYEPTGKPNRFRKGLFGWLVFIGLAVMLIVLVQNGKKPRAELSLDEFHTSFILPLVPWVLIFGCVWFFVFRILRQARKANPPSLTLPAAPIEVIIVNREPK